MVPKLGTASKNNSPKSLHVEILVATGSNEMDKFAIMKAWSWM